jgi:phage terminase small subunit
MSQKPEKTAYLQLPAKRQKFVDEYVKDCNGTQAAIRAGYSKKSAQVQSAQLLSIPIVKQAVEEKQAEIAKKNELTAEWVISKAKKVIERSLQEEPVYDHEGNPTGIYKFDAAGANGALKILAKYLGMDKSTVKHEGANGLGIVLHLGGKPKSLNDPEPGEDAKG